MKKLVIFSLGIASYLLCASSSGCQHDDVLNVTPDSTATGTGSGTETGAGTGTFTSPTSGAWIVTLYSEHGSSGTTSYSGYTFDFKSGGVFTVAKSGLTATGSWQQKTDDGKQKFIISISSSDNAIDDFDRGWLIAAGTGSRLDLKDEDGSSSRQLSFSKQ